MWTNDTMDNVEIVDETGYGTDMQGPSSMMNQMAGRASWTTSPTKTLIALWFVALGLYWAMGYVFRGQRS